MKKAEKKMILCSLALFILFLSVSWPGEKIIDTYTDIKKVISLNENVSHQDSCSETGDESNIYWYVLNGKREILFPDNGEIKIDDILAKDPQIADSLKISKYTIFDLDMDGNDELVLWVTKGNEEQCYFSVIVKNMDELYIGTTLYHRQMSELKEDGTFMFSGGASDWGIGRLVYSNGEFEIEKEMYCFSYIENGQQFVSFFNGDKQISQEQFDELFSAWMEKEEPMWIDYIELGTI